MSSKGGAIRWTAEMLAEFEARKKGPAHRLAPAQVPPMPKYRNEKVEQDGIIHDSRKEARRYGQLCVLERAGDIHDLKRQVRFELIPKQRRADGAAERACFYVTDFVYRKGDSQIVEDVKGMKTRDYIIKRKLMLYVHGITVIEV